MEDTVKAGGRVTAYKLADGGYTEDRRVYLADVARSEAEELLIALVGDQGQKIMDNAEAVIKALKKYLAAKARIGGA